MEVCGGAEGRRVRGKVAQAVDKASVDLVRSQPESQRHDLVERIASRQGLRKLEYIKILGMGSGQYDFITI